jgi:uncharacterized protein involved in exopolysaccharide biosynthesis
MSATFRVDPDGDSARMAEFRAQCRARRGTAWGIFGAVVVASLIIAAMVPPRYKATATLAVLPAPEFTVRQNAGSNAFSSSALAMDQIMEAETAILESDELHSHTLAAIGLARLYPSLAAAAPRSWAGAILHGVAGVVLAPWRTTPADPAAARQEEALRRFAKDLKVLPTKDANVITVSLSNRDGTVAAQAINTMLDAYAARRAKLYDDPQLAVVRRQTEGMASRVRDADVAVASFKTAHAVADIGAERDLLLRRRSETEQALATAAANAAEQTARLRTLGQQITRLPQTIPLYNEADADTRVQALDAALIDLRGRLDTARLQYRDTSRRVTDLRAQILARELERRRMLANPQPSVARAGRSPSLDPLLLDRAHAEAETSAAVARAQALRLDLAHENEGLARLTQEESALAELSRRRTAAADSFASASRVQDERQMTEAEDALRLATVRVIQAALVPQRPAPVPLLTVIAGVFLGAVCAIAWLVARFSLQPVFLTPEGLEQASGLPVLGVFSSREEIYGS